ncbi:hypothetical protein M0804_011072 [Polistes exclamans]|nr:hypothetical protein M0804_011072 [Polistes exclamans]
MARICRSRQIIMILGYLAIAVVLGQNPVDEKTTFEAAFQESNNDFQLKLGSSITTTTITAAELFSL